MKALAPSPPAACVDAGWFLRLVLGRLAIALALLVLPLPRASGGEGRGEGVRSSGSSRPVQAHPGPPAEMASSMRIPAPATAIPPSHTRTAPFT